MELRFYCKELGTFRISQIGTYKVYKQQYPDMVRVDDNGQPIMFDECIELLLAK